MKGQFSNFSSDQLFSWATFGYLLFVLLFICFIFGKKYCEDIRASTAIEKARFAGAMEEDLIVGINDKDVGYQMSLSEHYCERENDIMGQMGVAIIMVTALRHLVPRARAAGKRAAGQRAA